MAFFSSNDQLNDNNSTHNTVPVRPMGDVSRIFFCATGLVLTILTFVTNGAVVIFMFANRSRSSTSFYRLMRVYMIINFVSSGVTLLTIISLNTLGLDNYPFPPSRSPPNPLTDPGDHPPSGPGDHPPSGPGEHLQMRKDDKRIDIIMDGKIVLDLFVCIYTSIILFLIGLNRFGAFVWNPIEKYIFGRTGFRIINLLMLIVATGISAYMWLNGLTKRKFDDNKGVIVSETDKEADYTIEIFYIIPIFSFGFYLAAIISLRQKRSLVRSEQTSVLLSKTENITLKIGIEILTVYSLALIFHESCEWTPMVLENYFTETEKIIAAIPQFAVPIIFITRVSEFRSFLMNAICCKTSKNGKIDTADSLKSRQNNSKSNQNGKSNDTKKGSGTSPNLPATNPHSIHSAKHSQH